MLRRALTRLSTRLRQTLMFSDVSTTLLVQPMLVSIQHGLTKASNAPLARWRQFDQASRRKSACVLSYVRHRR
jgi:hypothetical protein